jgi:Flp pilus assembly protein TadD
MSPDLSESLARAQALIESTRIVDAVALLDPLKDLHPHDPDLWFALGRAQGMLGHEAEAEAAFLRAIELSPEMHEAHLNLALSRVYQQKLRDAIPGFVAARRLKPDYPGIDTTLFDILNRSCSKTPARRATSCRSAPSALRPSSAS